MFSADKNDDKYFPRAMVAMVATLADEDEGGSIRKPSRNRNLAGKSYQVSILLDAEVLYFLRIPRESFERDQFSTPSDWIES